MLEQWDKPVVIDFETYYDNEYSLKKITTEEYIRSDKFECIGVSVKIGQQPAEFYPREEGIPIVRALAEELGSVFVSHNCLFDMGILGMRYNIHPDMTVDTVTLARLTGVDRLAGGSSLAKLADWLPTVGVDIPPKGTAVHNMIGVHADDMTAEQWREYADYCKHDSEISSRLYYLLMPRMLGTEIEMANITTQMWTHPVIDLDRPLLEQYYANLEVERDRLMDDMARRLGLPSAEELGKVLRSRSKFPKLLETLGVEVPMKWSEKQQKNTPALAKTDPGFLALLEHEDPFIAELCQLRLDAASTLAMTRTKRLIEVSQRGLMPIPLRYAAAHTGRYGGMDGVNCFTPEHEVLTPTGWVRMDEYEEGTPIMQWWEDGRLSFDHNPAWLSKPYSGDVYEADSPMASFRVTPDHRISYVRYGRLGAGMVTKTVEALFHSSGIDNIPVDGMVDTPDCALTTAEIRYMVALQADGSLSGKNRHTFGFKKTRKIERFRELMAATGFNFREAVYDGVTTFVVTPEGFCNVNNKNFGPWILSLSARQLTIFCDELVYWDGNENSNTRSMEYNSTIKENVLWVDTAMRLCGRHSSIYELDTATVCGKTWRLYERTTRFGSITPKAHMKKSTYEGMVYCPKVDSDMILVRHGLKIFVSNQCQNLPKRTNDLTIRRSMRAPKGCLWVAADSSQIEARLVAYAAGQQDLVDVFTSGRDVYVDMATKIYDESYDDIMAQAKGRDATPEGKKKRNIAKEVVLACGYGMSPATFARRMELQGMHEIAEQAEFLVGTYRNAYPMIKAFWDTCGQALETMLVGGKLTFGTNGLFEADGTFEVFGNRIPVIFLPDGTKIFYQNLRKEGAGRRTEIFYDQMKRNLAKTKIYPAKVTENLIQGLAFSVLKDQARRMANRGLHLVLNIHDEWATIVPERLAGAAAAIMYEEMTSVPLYLPQNLLACEVDVGRNYADMSFVNVGKILARAGV